MPQLDGVLNGATGIGERLKRYVRLRNRPALFGLEHRHSHEADDGLVVGERGHDRHWFEGMLVQL